MCLNLCNPVGMPSVSCSGLVTLAQVHTTSYSSHVVRIYQLSLIIMHSSVTPCIVYIWECPFSFSRTELHYRESLQWKTSQQAWIISLFFWPEHLPGFSGHGNTIISFSYSWYTPLSPLFSVMTVSENPAKLSIPFRSNTWPTTMPVSFSNILSSSNFLSLMKRRCSLHFSAATGFLLFPNCWLEPLNSQIQKLPQSDTPTLNYW